MSESKFYTVMELAEKIGVPRTTINDWLNKYAPFIDFTMQGKRRVYSENTLSVLMKISELRNSGMSSFEIEKELAKNYAVHPETAEEPAFAPSPEQRQDSKADPSRPQIPQDPASAVSPEEALPAPASYTLIAKQQSDELARILGEKFQDMLGKMDDLERKASRTAVRAWTFFALACFLILLLAAAGFLMSRYARDWRESDRQKDAALFRLTETAGSLSRDNRSMQTQISTLQSGLENQKKEFSSMLQEYRQDMEKRHEAELAARKDLYAEKQLALLREKEMLQKSLEEKERQLREKSEMLKRQQQEKEAALKKSAEEKARLQEQVLLQDPAFQKIYWKK